MSIPYHDFVQTLIDIFWNTPYVIFWHSVYYVSSSRYRYYYAWPHMTMFKSLQLNEIDKSENPAAIIYHPTAGILRTPCIGLFKNEEDKIPYKSISICDCCFSLGIPRDNE